MEESMDGMHEPEPLQVSPEPEYNYQQEEVEEIEEGEKMEEEEEELEETLREQARKAEKLRDFLNELCGRLYEMAPSSPYDVSAIVDHRNIVPDEYFSAERSWKMLNPVLANIRATLDASPDNVEYGRPDLRESRMIRAPLGGAMERARRRMACRGVGVRGGLVESTHVPVSFEMPERIQRPPKPQQLQPQPQQRKAKIVAKQPKPKPKVPKAETWSVLFPDDKVKRAKAKSRATQSAPAKKVRAIIVEHPPRTSVIDEMQQTVRNNTEDTAVEASLTDIQTDLQDSVASQVAYLQSRGHMGELSPESIHSADNEYSVSRCVEPSLLGDRSTIVSHEGASAAIESLDRSNRIREVGFQAIHAMDDVLEQYRQLGVIANSSISG
ncbi:hypothetical protein J8273_6673 [Carpediemonas membranifera]|uniref:Uncharacterized protein n=1 Tax=Carpediemonas membranifera TaxID=201153 RepID=A0A8J6E0N7_9EUKA|nr:hypothetical protein J8273_6673 [Carpediemonas membranifera]|eukprot:KAG9392081.1 hypothetical protein J8273_6673 [Carpediemonas membranifera]